MTFSALPFLIAGQLLSPVADTDPPILGPGLDQFAPVVAAGQQTYLVVLADVARGGTYVSRVALDGTVLDPLGLPLGLAPYNVPKSGGRAAVFDGTDYAVLWNGEISGKRGIPLFARVQEDGGMLPGPIQVGRSCGSVSLAFGAGVAFAAWDNANLSIHGARVDGDGGLLDSPALVLVTFDGGAATDPQIASDGTRFLLAFQSNPNDGGAAIYTELLDPTGQPLGPLVQIGPPPANGPALAFARDHYLAAWLDLDGGFIVGARLDLDGGLIDSPALPLSAPGVTRQPQVGCQGTDCLVLWENDSHQVAGVSFLGDAGVTSLDAGGSGYAPLDPSVGCGAAGCLAAWHGLGSVGAAQTAWLSPGNDWAPDGGATLLSISNGQITPSAGANARGQWLLAWTDRRFGQDDLFAALITPDGGTGVPFFVASSLDTSAASSHSWIESTFLPAVASDGQDFLLAWTNRGANLVATLVPSDGGAPDGGLTIASGAGQSLGPASAFGSGEYLVAWTQTVNSSTAGISAARVTPTGLLLDDGGFTVAPPDAGNLALNSVAAGSATFLVSWVGDRVPGAFVSRILPDSTNLDPGGLALPTNQTGELAAAVDFDGRLYWAVWGQASPDGGDDVFGARVDEDAGLIDLTAIPISAGQELERLYPSVACVPGRCLAIWVDTRNGREDLYGAWLDRDGGVSPPGGLPLAVEPNDKWNANVLSDHHGRWLVVYQDGEGAPADNFRVRARWVLTAAADSGALDAGSGGGADAATGPDAGAPSARKFGIGCGCDFAPAGPWALLLLAALASRLRTGSRGTGSSPRGGTGPRRA